MPSDLLVLDPFTLRWAAWQLQARVELRRDEWVPAYIAALEESVVTLRAAAERVERGESPHPTTRLEGSGALDDA